MRLPTGQKEMNEMPRLRLARTTDKDALRALLPAASAQNARLEIVFGNGSRHPIGSPFDESTLEWLIETTQPGSDARLELVLPNVRSGRDAGRPRAK
jgi:hypothetical protein